MPRAPAPAAGRDRGRRSFALDHHGEADAARRTDGEQAEVEAPPDKLEQELHGDPRAGGAERMADGDRATVYVPALEVDLAERRRAVELVVGELLRVKLLHV